MKIEKNENRLYFDGCDTVQLAEKYGTPVYLISRTEIKERFAQLRESFVEKYPNTRVAYAAKAFFPLAMAKLVEEENMCVDVVSGGELYTAIKAGFPAERIEFNGNNKTEDEIRLAVSYGTGRIIIDGLSEISLVERVCKTENKKVKALFRITPGVKSSTHDYIVTGKKDSKFGVPLDDENILKAVELALNSPYIDLLGFHFHVGSQLFDNDSHLQAVKIVLDLVDKLKEKFSFIPTELNVGGGFGVTYTDEERQEFSYFLDPMMDMIYGHYKERGWELPAVVIEPGRSIVAEAGMTLYSVGAIKEIPNIRKYIAVNGGMTDNIRPALYQAEYKAILANKADKAGEEIITICGKCCESGDILIKDAIMPKAEEGDVLAILSTGAYGFSMANNYNKIPIPPVAMLEKGSDKLVVKRQSYDDMLLNEIL